jgi:hypothetical protein
MAHDIPEKLHIIRYVAVGCKDFLRCTKVDADVDATEVLAARTKRCL